jgi:amylosucrase
VADLAAEITARSRKIKKQDRLGLDKPDWYYDQKMLGMAVYVDLFTCDLKKLEAKIPYLKSLGINHLNLMLLYKSLDSNSKCIT